MPKRERLLTGIVPLDDGGGISSWFGRVDEFPSPECFAFWCCHDYEIVQDWRDLVERVRRFWIRICVCAEGQLDDRWGWHIEIVDCPGRGRFEVYLADVTFPLPAFKWVP